MVLLDLFRLLLAPLYSYCKYTGSVCTKISVVHTPILYKKLLLGCVLVMQYYDKQICISLLLTRTPVSAAQASNLPWNFMWMRSGQNGFGLSLLYTNCWGQVACLCCMNQGTGVLNQNTHTHAHTHILNHTHTHIITHTLRQFF